MPTIQRLPYPHATRMRDHWWWRPGWFPGRAFYTWHVTFDQPSDLHDLSGEYQQHLAKLGGLDLIPLPWLHLTVQGVGHADEIDDNDRASIVETARARLNVLAPPEILFHRAVVHPEAIVLPASPADAVSQIRTELRAAIADILGPSNVDGEPTNFRPHVSIAYNTKDRSAKPIIAAVDAVEPSPATITIREISLIALARDDGFYRWQTHASLAFRNA